MELPVQEGRFPLGNDQSGRTAVSRTLFLLQRLLEADLNLGLVVQLMRVLGQGGAT